MRHLAPTQRFSNRSDNYKKYRPGYPDEIVAYLQQAAGLSTKTRIADVGAGTGIFTDLLLRHGYQVQAVEPNTDMRAYMEQDLRHYPAFTSIEGTAEATNLADHSIDLITVAQAFHWFDLLPVRKEFERVLAPGGHVLLLWNIRQLDTPFLAAYNTVNEQYAADLKHTHRNNPENIQTFFQPYVVVRQRFTYTQALDREALKGYALSFSTVPIEGAPGYEAMMQGLDRLFDQYAQAGIVEMKYTTELYLSKLA